jgi:fatty acid desaturase
MTKDDPTVSFLFNRCKIAPGMSVEESKKRIFMNFLNPSFYIEGLLERFKEQNKMNLVGKMSMAVMWMLFLAIALATGSLSFFLLALVVPLFVLYPISSALRLSVEHTFPETQVGRKFDLDSMSILTNAVYCGEEYPKNSNTINIALWSCKMLLLHLPIRVFVLVGDTPVHDHHHRHPIYKDWPNYAFARIEALESETGNYEYREVWGYFNALTHTLKSLKQAKY